MFYIPLYYFEENCFDLNFFIHLIYTKIYNQLNYQKDLFEVNNETILVESNFIQN